MAIRNFKKYKIPDTPGVYFFKKGGEILYVGKAASLRDRVRSYMSKRLFDMRGPLLPKMIEEAAEIDWQATDSVLEALILEANLIKKYQPKYNTKEKSDKSFNYVCITRDESPKVVIKRGKELYPHPASPLLRGRSRGGGYLNIFGPFTNASLLREALKIIRKIFPFFDDRKGIKGKDEFYKQIKLVPENLAENKNNIKNIKLLFGGKKKTILSNLKKEMKKYAKNKEFEKAGEIKKQIFALQHINDVALINQDSIFAPLLVEEGVGGGNSKNHHLALKGTPPQQGGETRIEAYDIAHMSGKNMVGAMVVSKNGEFDKNEYRKFKIKSQDSPNDTGALKEILERRFMHREWEFPNLVVLDGGAAQLNVARRILKNFKLKIETVSVLKDKKHRPKAVLAPSLRPDLKGAQGLAFIKRYKKEIIALNAEAHRFAISYHTKIRAKSFLNKN